MKICRFDFVCFWLTIIVLLRATSLPAQSEGSRDSRRANPAVSGSQPARRPRENKGSAKDGKAPVYWTGSWRHWRWGYYVPVRFMLSPTYTQPDFESSLDVVLREVEKDGRRQLELVSGSWSANVEDPYVVNPEGDRVTMGRGGPVGGSLTGDDIKDKASVWYELAEGKPVVQFRFALAAEVYDRKAEFEWWEYNVNRSGPIYEVDRSKRHTSNETVLHGCITSPALRGDFDPQRPTVLRRYEGNEKYGWSWVFVRHPSPVVVELSACPKDWVPDPAVTVFDAVEVDSRHRGKTVDFTARVVEPANVAAQWRFRLESSRLPGICNNAYMPKHVRREWQGLIGRDSPDLLFDFRHYDGSRDSMTLLSTDAPWNVLETAQPSVSKTVTVTCLDYGAFGTLQAQANIGGHWYDAIVRETGENSARIPWDEDSNHIADAAKPTSSATRYNGLKPESDDDSIPAGNSQCRGDGLTAFEEYRGFVQFSGWSDTPFMHARTDPMKKDLFVFLQRTGRFELIELALPTFEYASELNVHAVYRDEEQWYVGPPEGTSDQPPPVQEDLPGRPGVAILHNDPPGRVINFLRGTHSAGPQCAVWLCDGRLNDHDHGKAFGNIHQMSPKDTTKVVIDISEIERFEARIRAEIGTAAFSIQLDQLLDRVVTHELGHAVGIQHHGDGNEILGNRIVPRLAVEKGQNSGNCDCAMKYVLWDYYIHQGMTAPAAYDKSRDRLGFQFCTEPAGTGINLIGTEKWQCGDAVPGRGGCKNQIVVNDHCHTVPEDGTAPGRGGPQPPQTDPAPSSRTAPGAGGTAPSHEPAPSQTAPPTEGQRAPAPAHARRNGTRPSADGAVPPAASSLEAAGRAAPTAGSGKPAPRSTASHAPGKDGPRATTGRVPHRSPSQLGRLLNLRPLSGDDVVVRGESAILELQIGRLPMLRPEDAENEGPKKPSGPPDSIGAPENPWRQQVAFFTVDDEGKSIPFPAKIELVGNVQRVTVRQGIDGRPPARQVSDHTGPAIDVTENALYVARFVVEATDTAALPAGPYPIYAVAAINPSDRGMKGGARLQTSHAILRIVDLADLPADERQPERRALVQARRAVDAGRFAEGERLSRVILAGTPDSSGVRLVLADCLEGQGKLRAACDEYRRALDDRPRPQSTRVAGGGSCDEPPLGPLSMLFAIEQKLGIKPPPPDLKGRPLEVPDATGNALRAPKAGNSDKIHPPAPEQPIVVERLAEHSLAAETPAGKQTKAPFPADADTISFTWELGLSATEDPVEARWISIDDDARATEHLIATGRSKRGKSSGEFTMKRPEEGFARGTYRLELRQRGDLIHVEKFAIGD